MNEPTKVLMLAPSTVALTGNIKATVDHNKPIKKLLIFASGASATESTFGRTGELEKLVSLEYKTRVESFVFDALENTDWFNPLPSSLKLEVAKNDLRKEGSGAKIYKIFKGMKSQFQTVWTKHIIIKNGENENDMIDRVCREVWAERHNNELRKKSKELVACASQCPVLCAP